MLMYVLQAMRKYIDKQIHVSSHDFEIKRQDKLKPEKKIQACTSGIQTHDLCDTGAVLYQLSYQANWEMTTL